MLLIAVFFRRRLQTPTIVDHQAVHQRASTSTLSARLPPVAIAMGQPNRTFAPKKSHSGPVCGTQEGGGGGGQTDLLANSKIESWLSISKRATAIAIPLASSSTSAAAS